MRVLLLLLLLGNPYLKTDDRQLERDYRWPDELRPVVATLRSETPWETVDPHTRRKVFFSDRLTMVVLEVTGQAGAPLSTHYHVHDQLSYLLEGRARVQVGDEVREVGPGGVWIPPSNVHHGMTPLTDRLVLVECFTPPREDFRDAPQRPVYGVNDVLSLVYRWFSLLDRRAPVEELLQHVDPRDWPAAEFRRWYAGLPDTRCAVEKVEVNERKDGWRVDLVVNRQVQRWLLDSDLRLRSIDTTK